MNRQDDSTTEGKKLSPWEPMHLTYRGEIRNIVQSGGGKLSVQFTEPGEADRKPKGQENH